MNSRCIIFYFLFFFLIDSSAQPSQYLEPGSVVVKFRPDAVANFETRLRALNRTPSDSSVLSVGIKSFDDVSLRYGATNMRRIFPHGGEYEEKHRKYGLHLWYEITVPDRENTEAVAAGYSIDDNIQIAEPRYKIRKNFGTSPDETFKNVNSEESYDPFFPRQWNFDNTGQSGGTPGADIRLVSAWEKAKTLGIRNNNVIVAVVDDGVYSNHEDLKDNMWESNGTNGYNFVKNKGTIVPDSHATHVAGVIAAVTNNKTGVSGIAGNADDGYGIKIMSVQILEGDNSVDFIGPAFIYAADNGSVISQNSWGYEKAGVYNNSDIEAINYFINEAGRDKVGEPRPGTPMVGGIVIFAAGNDGKDDKWYPAYFDNVLAVAATNHYGKLAYYSNHGSWIDISAPGGDTRERGTNSEGGIYSTSYRTTNNNDYQYLQGTSMACPHVSGVAALILSVYGNECFTPDMLRARLLHTATPLTTFDPTNAPIMGAGLVNAAAALEPFSEYAITDLSAQMVNAVSCQLNWTIPVDVGEFGFYDIACADEIITEDNFDQFIHDQVVIPQETGVNIETVVTGLNPATHYYIAIRNSDFGCQQNIISNVATVTTRNNMPPVAIKSLPDTTLRDVANETAIYIGDIFSDDDGDEMTYSISVDPINVANARVMNDTLFISPVAADETILTLTADDGNSGIATTTSLLTITQNLPPVFRNLVKDTMLIPRAKPLVIDLSKYAFDPEDDPIYFHVQPTDRDILIASVSGSTLTVNPRGHGYVALRVTATDKYSASTIELVHVTVEQKYVSEKTDQLLLYPNPTSDILWYSFSLADKSTSVTINVADASGRNIFQTTTENLSEGNHYYSIDIQNWSTGVYHFQYIKNGKTADVKRVVKQ